ncbi:MAG: hypothetical protein ACREKQ_10290, partial [Candidatus Rokuibacteriota bacterium]
NLHGSSGEDFIDVVREPAECIEKVLETLKSLNTRCRLVERVGAGTHARVASGIVARIVALSFLIAGARSVAFHRT